MSVNATSVRRVHRRVLDHLAADDGPVPRELVSSLARRDDPLLPAPALEELVDQVLSVVGGLGPLDPVLARAEVTEIMVNGPGPVWVEVEGRVRALDVELDRNAIDHLVERVVAPLGLRADRSSPMVDARLPDGSRVNVVLPPLAVDGPYVTIRRFGARAVPLGDVAAPAIAALLEWAVTGGCNIVVSGGTGSGKTTLLNALGSLLDPDERVVTVEDAAELRLPGDHVVRLEARPASAEGDGAVTIRELVRNALRMRPDRLLVGEVRGAEAIDMVQAMNTGHDGSLSTCHANGPADALRRLETMVLLGGVALPLAAVRDQLASAVDLVVHVARVEAGARAVVAVAEVLEPGRDGAARVRTLADRFHVRTLPRRMPRRSGHPPLHPRWVTP